MDKRKGIYHLRKDVAILKEKIEQANQLSAQYRRLKEAAIDKADQNMDIRLDGMNKFKDQLKEQAVTFVTRQELNGILSRVEQIEKKMDNWEGRLYVIGMLVGLLATLLTWLLNKYVH